MASATSVSVNQGDLIKDRYLVDRLIGKGSFGHVFLAKDQLNRDKQVAIKVLRLPPNKPLQEFSQLHLENMVLQHLGGGRLNPYPEAIGGFPNVHYFGSLSKLEHILVMDLLGPCLQNLFNICGRKFSLRTILILIDQLLFRLEYLHDKGYIHRDVKPENILMGTNESKDIVHLIDFGLSMTYWTNQQTKEHIIKESGSTSEGGHVGTGRYMSCWSHKSRQSSRRDDLESLAYVMAYLLKGSLPWQKVTGSTNKQRNDKIAEMKMSITPELLFEGFADEFVLFLKSVRQLKFEDKPTYRMYQRMFRELGTPNGIVYGKRGQFDWILKDAKEEKIEEKVGDEMKAEG